MKIELKTWDEIKREYEEMERMPCKPADIKKLAVGTIIDEEQSVRWNREQVEKNNLAYRDEVKRLNQEKMQRYNECLEDIYRKIQDDVGHGISRKQAMVLWQHAYNHGHGCGFNDILIYLDELVDLIQTFLEKDN